MVAADAATIDVGCARGRRTVDPALGSQDTFPFAGGVQRDEMVVASETTIEGNCTSLATGKEIAQC